MASTAVLLVDEKGPYLDALVKRLSRRGLNVECAVDGREALNYLETPHGSSFDVVILDMNMTHTNSLETLVAIKRLHPLTEVILQTAFPEADAVIEGMKLGAFDYLAKSGDPEVLVRRIQEAANKKANAVNRILASRTTL